MELMSEISTSANLAIKKHFICTLKQKMSFLKLWILIQQYTATDFQGWSKMTLKIKTAYFSIFDWRGLTSEVIEMGLCC